jgi:parallel beta-helix repeat protein
LHVGPVRKDWFVNIPETDVGLGDLIATYTTYEPAVVSAAIKARDAAIEAESEAKQAAIDAEAKRVAAETAANLTGQDRLHVDNVRALLDEAYDESQAGMALPPRLMESELNATYADKGIEAEVATKANAVADVGLVATPSGGTTDDAPKIAALLAALPAGGTLQLRSGTYRIASLLSINKPVRIRGAGRGQTTLLMIADKFLGADASNVTFESMTFSHPTGTYRLFNESKSAASHRTGWTFRDCKFDGVGLVFSKVGGLMPNGSATTVGTDVAGGITVTGCEVTGYKGAFGIELQGVDGAVVENCWVHHNGTTDKANGEGIKLNYGATGVRITSNILEYNYRDGIDLYNCGAAVVSGNVLRNNGHWGAEAKWANADAAAVTAAYRIIIANNLVSGNGSGGLVVSPPGTIVEGNRIWGHVGKGIIADGAFDATTTAHSAGIIVRGNRVEGGNYGIEFNNAVKDGLIAENIVTGASIDGIALQPQTLDCIVTGNRSYGNGNKGIRINGSGHRIGANKSQDPGDVYITPGITGCMRSQMVAVT